MRSVLLLTSLVAALALVAAGCGGDDEPETSGAAEWAEDVCTAASSWTSSLRAIGERFTDLSSLSQESLEEAATDAREATDDLVDELEGLGAPDTESGDEAKQVVDDLADALDSGADEAQEAVEDIDGVTDIPNAISTLSTTLASMSQAVSTTVTTLTSGELGDELRTAFEQAPACDELTSSSS